MKGVSATSIESKIKRGIITKNALVKLGDLKHPRLDPEIADADLARNTSFAHKIAHDNNKARAAADDDDLADLPDDAPADPNAKPTDKELYRYRDAKTDTEELRAELLRIEVSEAKGKLLNAEAVRKEITKLTGETKDALLNIAAKVAPLLVSIVDPVEMETVLQREINEALESLSRFKL